MSAQTQIVDAQWNTGTLMYTCAHTAHNNYTFYNRMYTSELWDEHMHTSLETMKDY